VTQGDQDQWRASDAEREAVADHLNAAVGEGRLTLEEFSARVAKAYAARTHGELDYVVRDLPPAGWTTRIIDAHPMRRLARPRYAPLELLFGAVRRSGRWRLPPDTALGVAVGPIKLDLRGADLTSRMVTLSARTVVGSIKVWVPQGIRVYVEGVTTVGSRTVEESDPPPHLDVPTLRLRLDTVVGSVKVYRT
jgi:hypothetical protein